ncbi:hypothetical protein SADUNF_Sadunf08G0063900 [Salix dunnii]|uniref:NAC domain-containing protein n=1 Tax=Salix dunnii TaxID=1413687 RepID=A0A835JY61_9ROSI|nr:hypothetical protein SADUNF_Sadunf08G0063900 [Salix dunnii]
MGSQRVTELPRQMQDWFGSSKRVEDGWVVCRVFKKKNQTRGFLPEVSQEVHFPHMKASASSFPLDPKQNQLQSLYHDSTFDGSMHLPQLFSPESVVAPSFASPLSLNHMNDIECSQNLLRLTSTGCGFEHPAGRFNGDWSLLDKLLASHQNLDPQQHYQNKRNSSSQIVDPVGTSTQKFPFQYLGFETDILRFSK